MTLTKAISTHAADLRLNQNELVSISKFCANPPKFIHQVRDSGNRIVLIRHGHPAAALVPLWMLSVVEAWQNGRSAEDSFYGDNYK